MDEIDWEDVDFDEQKAKELEFARRLDVHRWSDHPEVNSFIKKIYENNFCEGNSKVRLRQLKVVLLDLYVAWSADPALKISYSRNVNDYKAGNIYNELRISKLTIDVVDQLQKVGLIEVAIGFKDRETNIGRLSRMWPRERLIEMFKSAKFSVFDVASANDRLPIELRNENKEPIEFKIKKELEASIKLLSTYNEILQRHHISVPYLESKAIDVDMNHGDKTGYVLVTQAEKFVYRVFNNSSFQRGGRFYGGWWNTCPRDMRDDILIDNEITLEIDYSSLHPTMLYAYEGIDYWSQIGADPYQIDEVSFQKNPNALRALAKDVLLILFNVEDEKSLPAAFRKGALKGSNEKNLKDAQIYEIIEQLRILHEPIQEHFCTGIGLSLQNDDSKIAESVLQHFVGRGEPILLVHDSFVVREYLHEELELVMERAYRQIMGQEYRSKAKYAGYTYEDVMDLLNSRYNHAQARQSEEEQAEDLALYRKAEPKRSQVFLREWEQFQQWRNTQAPVST